MTPGKIRLTGEKETLLITLYGRAMQSRSKRPVLRDPWAEEAVEKIDYDFAKFKTGRSTAYLVALRAAQHDRWTRKFLARHPDATVLHLGCGLDSRAFRVSPPATVRWFDVDYPEVIDLRRRLYPEHPGYRMIGSSLADTEWLREIPTTHPVFIVAEGVTMYLKEDVVKHLLNALLDRFPSGELAFDAHTPEMNAWFTKNVRTVRGTTATLYWGLGDPEDLQKLESRLEPIEDRWAPLLDAFPGMPWSLRLMVRAMGLLPGLKLMRCLLYRFGNP